MSTIVTQTKVITINAGDCFLLPSDAVIEAVSTDGAVTFSSDNCPALVNTLQTKTEAFTCYIALFAGPQTDGSWSSATQNLEPGNYFVEAIVINGVEYAIPAIQMGNTDDGPYDADGQVYNFTNFLKSGSNPLATLFGATITSEVNSDKGSSGSSENRGWSVKIVFQTVPSIGDNMFFKVRTQLVGQFESVPSTNIYVKVNAC